MREILTNCEVIGIKDLVCPINYYPQRQPLEGTFSHNPVLDRFFSERLFYCRVPEQVRVPATMRIADNRHSSRDGLKTFDILEELAKVAGESNVFLEINTLLSGGFSSAQGRAERLSQEKSKFWYCPTGKEIRTFWRQMITWLLQKHDFSGILLAKTSFEWPFASIAQGVRRLTCFCDRCAVQFQQRYGYSLDSVRTRLLSLDARVIARYLRQCLENRKAEGIERHRAQLLQDDAILSSWFLFRCELVTDWIRDLVLLVRQLKPGMSIGLETYVPSIAYLYGHEHSLLSALDLDWVSPHALLAPRKELASQLQIDYSLSAFLSNIMPETSSLQRQYVEAKAQLVPVVQIWGASEDMVSQWCGEIHRATGRAAFHCYGWASLEQLRSIKTLLAPNRTPLISRTKMIAMVGDSSSEASLRHYLSERKDLSNHLYLACYYAWYFAIAEITRGFLRVENETFLYALGAYGEEKYAGALGQSSIKPIERSHDIRLIVEPKLTDEDVNRLAREGVPDAYARLRRVGKRSRVGFHLSVESQWAYVPYWVFYDPEKGEVEAINALFRVPDAYIKNLILSGPLSCYLDIMHERITHHD